MIFSKKFSRGHTMKIQLVNTKLLALLLLAIVPVTAAMAQPDNEPGMAKLPANPQGGPPPDAVLTPDQKLIDTRETFAGMMNPAKAISLSTPESTVRSFMWGFFKGDFKIARECVEGSLPYEKLIEVEKTIKKEMLDSAGEVRVLISEVHTYINGKNATVTLHFLASVDKEKQKIMVIESVERIKLHKNENTWQIVPEYHEPMEPIMGTPMLAEDILGNFFRVFVTADALSAAGTEAACQSNMKQLGLGIMMHVQDFDEVFTLTDDWVQQLLPYVKNEVITKCPAGENKNTAYSINNGLKGKKLVDLRGREHVIMVYEGQDGKFEYRHRTNTATNILFADGHVKAYSKNELDLALQNGTVRWKPEN